MEFFKQNTHIDFMGQRLWAALLSSVLLVASLVLLSVKGINWGLDFSGGVQIELHYEQSADIAKIRNLLQNSGFNNAVVKLYGSTQNVQISFKMAHSALDNNLDDKNQRNQLIDRLKQALPDAQIVQINYIGPQIGQELVEKGVLAIIISLIATTIYIAMRFEYRFALSSSLALIHDPILILGVFSLFNLEFDTIALTALLMVIGYSLNDTIVVFDRVREVFRNVQQGSPVEIMNLSINQTLSRTIMTSVLTLLAIISLYLFGGPVLHGFSVAFMVGIIVGTYSSIYVAGALALLFGLKREDLLPRAKTPVDDLP